MKNFVYDVIEVGYVKNELCGNKLLLSKIVYVCIVIIFVCFWFLVYVIFESGGLVIYKINRGVVGFIWI